MATFVMILDLVPAILVACLPIFNAIMITANGANKRTQLRGLPVLGCLLVLAIARCGGGSSTPPATPTPPSGPPGGGSPPPTAAPFDAVAVDLQGRALEHAQVKYMSGGKAVGDPAITISADESAHWCDARPKPCSAAPPGFFSSASPTPFGLYILKVKTADERTASSLPIRFREGWSPRAIAFAVPAPPPPSSVCTGDYFRPGTWVLAASYFGAVATPPDVLAADLTRMASVGICDIRVWTEWNTPDDSSRVFDANGNSVRLDDLGRVVQTACDLGMNVDLTMSTARYTIAATGFSRAAQQRALEALVTAFDRDSCVGFIDADNESNKSGAPGDAGIQYLSPEEIRTLFSAARAIDPTRKLTVSAAGAPFGTTTGVLSGAEWYTSIEALGTQLDLLAPHFPRSPTWGETEGPNLTALVAHMHAPVPPVYDQEPARQRDDGTSWPVQSYVDAYQGAKAAGAMGFCFHTAAGTHDSADSQPSWWDDLDPSEQQIVDQLTALAR